MESPDNDLRLGQVSGDAASILSARFDEEKRAFLEGEGKALLGRRISELGLSLRGTAVEELVNKLYLELEAKGLSFHPPVYLSDEWGCPEGVPLIGIPFYLADPKLTALEEEMVVEIEGEVETMRYLRHEAGHAFNYAYRLYDQPEWRKVFGPYSRPYRERFRVDPLSTKYVRHIHGWYAQKHPDEDFAETFAVWLTPDIDWARDYAGWQALKKLEYVDHVMREIRNEIPEVPEPTEEDLPVDAMHYTLAEHYKGFQQHLPLEDERYFDADLRLIFEPAPPGRGAPQASDFIRRFRSELIRRISYWTGENSGSVRWFIDVVTQRTEALNLQISGRQESALIDLAVFATSVLVNYRNREEEAES